MIDPKKVFDVVLDGVDHKDYPDYCDAFIVTAKINDNGAARELTCDEIEALEVDYPDEVYALIMETIHDGRN